MERALNEHETGYLLDHLARYYTGPDLRDYLVYGEESGGDRDPESGGDRDPDSGVLHVPASTGLLETNKVVTIGKVPVLFPCSTNSTWYQVEGSRIRFNHDILKSAFFLLSGYQEYSKTNLDSLGRIPWDQTVQFRLGITHIPVVNYYFREILEAFGKVCEIKGLPFKIKPPGAPQLLLSHDVDRIRKYSLRNMAYMWLQLSGIIRSPHSPAKKRKYFSDYTKGYLTGKTDPFRNIPAMVKQEKEQGINSTWFLLEKRGRKNSRYQFSDKYISGLIKMFESGENEVGIHGTRESSEDQNAMSGGVERLNDVCRKSVCGIRQHFLKYSNPATPGIQEKAGLIYDATLGFAEQPGFRNSYSHPFRLYDFENQKAFNIVQLPLLVMDVTLLEYLRVPVKDIPGTISPLLEEVARFGGAFSMLWHNCNLDEEEYPGINEMYQQLLREILTSGYEPRTNEQVAREFISSGA